MLRRNNGEMDAPLLYGVPRLILFRRRHRKVRLVRNPALSAGVRGRVDRPGPRVVPEKCATETHP